MTSITLPHNVDPSPLFLPPGLVPDPSHITRLAVYGTLRDDDDSGASWTSSFIANRTSACSGIVRGAKLYWAHKLKSTHCTQRAAPSLPPPLPCTVLTPSPSAVSLDCHCRQLSLRTRHQQHQRPHTCASDDVRSRRGVDQEAGRGRLDPKAMTRRQRGGASM